MRLRFLLLLLPLLAACKHKNAGLIESAPTISATYRDGTGREISLSRTPERVVSLAASTTEMLYAIGAGEKLVARSQSCDFPPEVISKPVVTTYPDLDLESVLAQKPDLVVTTTEIHKPDVAAYFEQLGMKVYFQKFSRLEDIPANIRALSQILNTGTTGNKLADSLSALTEGIRKATANEIKYSVMVLVSIDPLYVIGGGSYVNEMIDVAGGKNVFAGMKEPYPQVTVEAIIKAAPEYIILPTDDEQEYAKFISAYPEVYTTVPAALQNRAFIMNPDKVFRPGPRTFDGLTEMVSILHPRVDLTSLTDAP